MERPPRTPSLLVATAACAALLGLFVALSWLAAGQKSPTLDEPRQAIGAFLHVFHGDYRVNPEDPPLWHWWMMLPLRGDALQLDFADVLWRERLLLDTSLQNTFATRSLFQTPGNDGLAIVTAARAMMLAAGAILGALIAWLAFRLAGPLAGPLAAVIAAALYCLDPNFLAHAPLVKNDVAIALCMLGMTSAVWSVGRRVTWWNLPLPGLLFGAALGVKFSGVLLAPMLAVLLLARAAMRRPWTVLARPLTSRGARLAAALSIGVVSASLSLLVVWACYGFRFEPTPQWGVLLPTHTQVEAAARNEFFNEHGTEPSPAQLAQWPRSPLVRLALVAERHRLLPQPWLYGILFQYHTSLRHTTFLLGRHSETGVWYYFPLAMLFKTPLATLAAFAVALAVLAPTLRRRRKAQGSAVGLGIDRWGALCLTVPPIIYAVSALTSNFNLGLRHILPVYPFLYLLTAIALAHLARRSRSLFRPLALLLMLALAVETFASFPDFIPFFNAISKPHRLTLLSDSNLDWGQDLPALALWRQRNAASGRLYFSYFGTTDPNVYGIDYARLPGGFWLGPPVEWLAGGGRPGVLAISATHLQGVNLPLSLREYYAPLRNVTPQAVLGGSIYIYRVPLPPGNELRLPTRQQIEADLRRRR